MEKLAVSRREAAKMLGVSAATIDRMVRAGKIKRVYLAPRTPRFYVRDIERLMAGEEPGEIQRKDLETLVSQESDERIVPPEQNTESA